MGAAETNLAWFINVWLSVRTLLAEDIMINDRITVKTGQSLCDVQTFLVGLLLGGVYYRSVYYKGIIL